MARKKQSGQQAVSRFGAEKPGHAHKNRGAKGHAETPAPRTPEAHNQRDDEALAAADDDASSTYTELDALEARAQRGAAGDDDSLIGTDGEETPVSRAADLEVTEPQGDVDLLSDTIRNASLFDQPSEEGDPHAPRIAADEMARDEHEGTSARAVEQQREREKLRKAREHDEPARPKRSNHAR
jgi:hypothetical protein